jgi:hypothetical protein
MLYRAIGLVLDFIHRLVCGRQKIPNNLKQGLLEKSKLAQHAYVEDHRVSWDEARVLEVERNTRYRKYKESAHMACSTNPISQPSLDISPIWIPLISEEVNKPK